MKTERCFGALCSVAWMCTLSASAATIVFTATDLVDTTLGEDLWEYGYRVSDAAFTANQGFSIFFAHTLYRRIESPPPVVNADWDLLTVQPDAALMSAGFYDALAVRSTPSLADVFTAKFVWLGTGAPGAQPFTLYNADFSTREQGFTVVPEPGACWLLLAAWPLISRRRRNDSF